MGERDVADAERCEHPQGAEGILNGVPALDADQAGDSPRLEVALDVGRSSRHGEVTRILRAQPLDQVDLLERVHRRVRPGIHRGDGNVGGPELRSHPLTNPRRYRAWQAMPPVAAPRPPGTDRRTAGIAAPRIRLATRPARRSSDRPGTARPTRVG